MDAARYARVRELFLAVDELPESRQREYLVSQCDDDPELLEEVLSLLREHNAHSAMREGQAAKAPAIPAPIDEASSLVAEDSDGPVPAEVKSGDRTDDAADSDRSDGASESATTSAAPFLPGDHSAPVSDSSSTSEPRSGRRSKRTASTAAQQNSPNPSAQVTQHRSQRTHAAPRYPDASGRRRAGKRRQKPASTGLWKTKARRDQRFNSGWLWLAAVVPTIVIGWWTYSNVAASLREAAASELAGVADGVQSSAKRFLDDQARLAESWTRAPDLQQAVIALARQSDAEPEQLRVSEHALVIRRQLIALSKRRDIKYVVWDRTGKIIASWLEDGADIGENVSPDGAANLARAMRGETVLFGPEILRPDVPGFQPETEAPVMAEIMPIRDTQGSVVATMLIRGFGMFESFDKIFSDAASRGGLDVYAVDRNGMMVSNSPVASRLDGDSDTAPACRLRVSDPGEEPLIDPLDLSIRKTQPLTYSVAGASNGSSDSKIDGYRNYAGSEVIGAWRWIETYGLGVVVERTAESAFATAGIVRLGFFSLAVILSLTAFLAASQISKRTALAQAAIHPLSRYSLTDELGSGGMGVVYRAKHSQLGRDTALKVLRGDRDNLEERMRFDREAKLAASLSNPHTVTIYDYGRGEEGEAYCVMEFLKGITLYDVVARSGYQPIGRVLFILRQICDSLGEAHKLGLVHRDIKPQNVMLSLDASVGDWAVVFDFGLAKPLQPDADSFQTAETIWAGTPMYMAPERYREPNKIDPRSDIYSVGCIAYFLLSGRPPFIECDPESLFALVLTEQPISISVHRDEELPREINQLVKQCMAKNADQRFATIHALAGELDRLILEFPWSVEEARQWWRIHGEEVQ